MINLLATYRPLHTARLVMEASAVKSTAVRSSVSAKNADQTKVARCALYEVRKGKGGKTVLAVYKAEKAAEKKALELGGHVVVRLVTLDEYKATASSAKK